MLAKIIMEVVRLPEAFFGRAYGLPSGEMQPPVLQNRQGREPVGFSSSALLTSCLEFLLSSVQVWLLSSTAEFCGLGTASPAPAWGR